MRTKKPIREELFYKKGERRALPFFLRRPNADCLHHSKTRELHKLLGTYKRFSGARTRTLENRSKMEARGFEPLSRDISDQTSTYVVVSLTFA